MIRIGSSRPTLIAALSFACLRQMEAWAEEVDVNDPASVMAYRDEFRAGAHRKCMLYVERRLAAEGKEFREPRRNVAKKFCACTSKEITALVSDEQIESLKIVMTNPSLRPQREQVVTECARSADITTN